MVGLRQEEREVRVVTMKGDEECDRPNLNWPSTS